MIKKVYLATDHAGFELKEKLKTHLLESGYNVKDFGANIYNKEDDYPDFIKPLAEEVAKDPDGVMGIILGYSGQGEAMTANRYKKVRAMEYHGGNLNIIKLARDHNDANVLSLGAGFVTEEEAKGAVNLFLETPFDGTNRNKRHVRRIEKIDS